MTTAPPNPGKQALKAWIRAMDAIKILEDRPAATLPALIAELAETHGESPALVGQHETLSYRALNARANRYAHWARQQDFGPGDVIALFMLNCPDYAAIWLGLTQAGCVVALLNTNLTGDALAHCLRAAAPKAVIAAKSLFAGLPNLANGWVHGGDYGTLPRIDTAIENLSSDPPRFAAPPKLSDPALLIYTSGTTGLPKAANVPHFRLVEWSFWFAGMMDAQATDRLYNCLPMYHSTGGVVAIGAMLVRGGAVVIRERFSASNFWADIAAENCTIFQYIGELCRYLNNAPDAGRETQHRLRLVCGNGLRADVWESFQNRFKIPQVLEFYAATEGSISLYNCEGKPGAIGRVPGFLTHRFPIALVRCDPETGEPVRDDGGLCTPCAPGEPGEALGRFAAAHAAFYTDDAASSRKILRDVIAHGDAWFRSGDLMRKDAAGYYYFVDRIGDTFRWKGENVSTAEVAAVITACPGVTAAVVYGVTVPGHEGRAGMAAITTGAGFELDDLRRHLTTGLPEYARPVFIRLCETLQATGTFKFQTTQLVREGYAPAADRIWYHDRRAGEIIPCDDDVRYRIETGAERL